MKRVLLTGASGFIGYHCIEPLLDRGFEVHAVYVEGPDETSRSIHCHKANLLDEKEITRVLSDVKPSHLLHLAWYVVPGKLISSPENYLWVQSSLSLLQRFVECGGKRVVMAGSSYEYDWNYGFCSEKVTPCSPDTTYGVCKNALGQLTAAYSKSMGISSGWGRVFFLYGPREHPDRLVSSIIRSLLRNEPARTSHGLQIRDYLHVQDVANGLVAILDSNTEGPVNIGTGQPITLKEIITEIGRKLQKEHLIQLGAIPARANDAPLVVADNRRLKDEVGWKQQYDLSSGLDQTIDWWKKNLNL